MHSSDLKPSRRAFLAGAAAISLLPVTARALTASQAADLINRVMNEILTVVNSSASEAQALASFEQTLARYSDMGVIARSVLGQPWRSATGAQQAAFTTAFRGYLARKYGKEFRTYRGSDYKLGAATDRGNKGVLVNSVVNVPGSAPVAVDWQVIDMGRGAKVFDLLIEGISMVGTERSEVRAIYESNRNNLDSTINDLTRRG